MEDFSLLDNQDWEKMKLKPLEIIKLRKNLPSFQKNSSINISQHPSNVSSTTGTTKGGTITSTIIAQGSSSMVVFRQTLSPGHSVLKMSLILSGPKPELPLLQELKKLYQFPYMVKLDHIIEECTEWYKGWKWDTDANPHQLTQDEAMAIVLYTHDLNQNGPKEQNFYYLLNEMLRRRNNEEMNAWSGYLYYFLTALKKVPDVATTLYRGIPANCKDVIEKDYKKDRPIHWSGFSSGTELEEVAKRFAGPGGILFRIQIFNGKSISKCSFIPNEKEILLSPNMKFKVTEALHLDSNGFYYVDLKEKQKLLVY